MDSKKDKGLFNLGRAKPKKNEDIENKEANSSKSPESEPPKPPAPDSDPMVEEAENTQAVDNQLPKWPKQVNNKIFTVLRGNRPDEIPVWIMRQAGRYLPEFREMRKEYDFLTLIHTPKLACEVTMMPIKRFHFDVAIIFSDILVIPEALGMELVMNPGPFFPNTLTPETMDGILKVDGCVDRLTYVGEALTLARNELNGEAVLFGFSGAPWTLMCYMIEGKHADNWVKARSWFYTNPAETHKLVNLLTDVIIDYCVMQAKYGAQVIQIFDTNASILSKDLYFEFFLAPVKRIRKEVKEKLIKEGHPSVPMVYFAKGIYYALDEIAKMEYDIVGLDHTTSPEEARAISDNQIKVFQGNLDPVALFAPPKQIKDMTVEMLESFEGSKLIANLGHGILPETPLESVQAFIDAVRGYSRPHSTLMHMYLDYSD